MTLQEIRQEMEPLLHKLAELSEADQLALLTRIRQQFPTEEVEDTASPLLRMARQALADHQSGKTVPFEQFVEQVENDPEHKFRKP